MKWRAGCAETAVSKILYGRLAVEIRLCGHFFCQDISCRICIRPICFVSLHWQGKRDGVSFFYVPKPLTAPQPPKEGFSGLNGFAKGPLLHFRSVRMSFWVWPFRNVVWAEWEN